MIMSDEEARARVETYIAAYEDAPTWGGPTMYPAPPSIADIKALLALAAKPLNAGEVAVNETPDMLSALQHLPQPWPARRKLADVRETVHLAPDAAYALEVCGPDPAQRQRIARAIWVMLRRVDRTGETDHRPVLERMERDDAHEQYLQEVADGAYGDHPLVAARAGEALAERRALKAIAPTETPATLASPTPAIDTVKDEASARYSGFQSAVTAMRSWAGGFYSENSAARLRAIADDLEAHRDEILGHGLAPVAQKAPGDAG